MYPLVADGGEVTVLRDLAAFSYGSWAVEWPESVPEEQRPELPDDRDFGYALKLKEPPGRMGRRFVRANVSITAQDFDNEGQPMPFSGESDVEQVLEEAAERVDGDVFFEREITRAGLGALVPRVDFDVDDVVPVLIWGKTILSPVTSIEDVAEAGAVVDYRVHVGGQLLRDDAARERANREVERTIAQERRERVESVAKERKARKSDVGSVREVLTGAGGSDSDLLASLVGMNRQLQATDSDPQPGLIPAYIELNTKLWETQKKVNDALEAGQRANRDLIEVQQAVSEANREALREIEQTNKARDLLVDRLQQQELQSRSQRIRFFSLADGSNEHWDVTQQDAIFGADSYSLSAKGDWVGSAVGMHTYTKRNSISGTTNSGYINETVTKPLSLTVSAGNRTVSIGGSSGIVWYRVDAGRVRTVRLERTNFLPEHNQWVQVDAFNVLNAGRYTLQTRVVWAAVHRGANYDFRVRVDGGTVVSDSSGTDFGPIGPWGNGVRSREADLVQRDLRVGQRVVFEVRTDASGAASRGVQSAVCRASWIEEE